MNSEELRQRLLEAFRMESRDHLARIRQCFEQLPEGPLEEGMRSLHTLKGAARAVEMPEVERAAHLLEEILQRYKKGSLGRTAVDGLEREAGRLEDLVGGSLGMRPMPDVESMLRELAERLGEEVPAPAMTVRRAGETSSGPREVRPSARVSAEALRELLSSSRRLSAASADLSELLTDLGEQARASAPQIRDLHERMAAVVHEVADAARDAEEQTARALLAPAEDVWGWLPSIVRDLAQAEGKRVEFESEGLENRVEAPVLEALVDPLLHLLRNSVHHGLETPAERKKAGKPSRGRIAVRLTLQAQHLQLVVEDDGRGLDLDTLRTRLNRPDAFPDELAELLIDSGVSTAASVTEMAGRGLGLGAVRERLRSLGGSLAFVKPEEPGTRIRLTLPRTLSAESVLLVRCDSQVLALPSRALRYLRWAARDNLLPGPTGEGSIWTEDDKVYPVQSLAARLGLRPPKAGPSLKLALVGSVALWVDDWIGHQEAIISPLSLPGGPYPHIMGVFWRTSGEACLVLDPAFVGKLDPAAGLTLTPEDRRQTPRILVVDDSLTSRALARGVLETHGYRVETAEDGVQALERLQAESFDLLLSDIQMPNMDGLSLLTELRRRPQFSELPVVLLTSQGAPEEQERGLELGADAYLVKARFSQDELLEVIRQLC